jgi:hypothetical protein
MLQLLALLFGVRFSHARSVVLATLPLSLPLLLDAYIDLNRWETLYETTEGSVLVEGIALNSRRFRAQRNFYIAFFTLVLQGAIYLTECVLQREAATEKKLKAVEIKYNQLRRELDGKLNKEIDEATQ